MRKQVVLHLALAAGLLLGFCTVAMAQPAGRTVKIIYAFSAGNSGDGLARIVADRLGAHLGTAVIVENRAGASGRIGTKTVIAAEPDGSTLLIAPMGPIALHPVVYSNLDFEPFKDLLPLSQVVTFDIALAVGPGSTARTLKELIDTLKAEPDKATYGTPGLGGLPHFFAVMFATSAGIKLRNVPYRGSAAVVNDLVAGQLPVAFVPTADNVELHRGGRTRILATSAKARSPFLPDVPTFAEAGYSLSGEGWYSMYAPARTPTPVVDRISKAIQSLMREPETRERIARLGLVPTGTTGDELARIQVADRALWEPAIRASGFKPTD